MSLKLVGEVGQFGAEPTASGVPGRVMCLMQRGPEQLRQSWASCFAQKWTVT